MLYVGTARATVTPPIGTPLAGFGHRDHGAEHILDDLEVRVIWLQNDTHNAEAICMICADLIGFSAEMTTAIRTTLHHTLGIAGDHILLAASHTHSGPQTCANMLGVGALILEVVANIAQSIVTAAHTASGNLVPAQIQYGWGQCDGYAVNRRTIKDGRALFAPNPGGTHDNDVSVITCISANTGAVLAALFHFTCHPTTMGDYRITADYPGAARRRIESELGADAIAAFLPGCFADVRPHCTYIGGTKFRSGQSEDVIEFGNALGDVVVQTIRSGTMRMLSPLLAGYVNSIELTLAETPTIETISHWLMHGDKLQRQLAVSLLSDGGQRQPRMSLQRIDLASELSIIALGGEVCCDYGLAIKQLDPHKTLIPVAYSNGLVGYIPSAHMFTEGGYEVVEAGSYFGLPSPFTPAIENDVMASVRALVAMTHGS